MYKILVVDDYDNTRRLTGMFLTEMGYDVAVSHCGEDAIEKVKDLKPDVMLLDLGLPGIDGMEVLKRVRQFDREIGVIMVTAVKDEDVAGEAFESGADEYITKPIDFSRLEESLLVDLIMKRNPAEPPSRDGVEIE